MWSSLNFPTLFLWLLTLGIVGLIILPSELSAGRVPDQVQVTVFRNKIIGVSALRGGAVIELLTPAEKVLDSGARGQVGFVLTNRRILGFGARTNAWAIQRFSLKESVQGEVKLGDQIVLAVTNLRAHALSPLFFNWAIAPFTVGEALVSFEIGSNIGLVITTRHVRGFSASVGGWSSLNLTPAEKILDVDVGDTTATIQTNFNLLIFNAATGSFQKLR